VGDKGRAHLFHIRAAPIKNNISREVLTHTHKSQPGPQQSAEHNTCHLCRNNRMFSSKVLIVIAYASIFRVPRGHAADPQKSE
jgi:hypothetical protein